MEDGLAFLIFFLFGITFLPPIILLILAGVRWNTKRSRAKIYLIVGLAWLIIGGGTCLSLLGM